MTPYPEGLLRNQSRPCINPSCRYLRRGLDPTCRDCARKWRCYGSPTGRPIYRKEWLREQSRVSRLFATNSTHPGLVAAERLIADWLEGSVQCQVYDQDGMRAVWPGAREVARLARAAVPPRRILESVCGIGLYLFRLPIMSKLEEEHAVARAVLELAPRAVRSSRQSGKLKHYRAAPTRGDLVAVGAYLIEHLSGVVANVRISLEAIELEDTRREAARRAPFVLSA